MALIPLAFDYILWFLAMLRRLFNNILLESPIHQHSESSLFSHPFTKDDTTPFGWLCNSAPCFPVPASNIKIINEPSQFYNTILQYCHNATNRIRLVSLYLGTGELETQIVNAVKSNEQFILHNLDVNILLDYTRGSRNKHNSRTVLLPLLQQRNCLVYLYHTPMLRGLLKKYMPNRYNELIGLQHMKLYIFDDTLVISGANLSNDYFTNRQDRYVLIKDKNLTDFYCGLIDKVQSFSFKIDKNNKLSFDNDWKCSPYEGSRVEFVQRAGNSIKTYLNQAIQGNRHIKADCDTYIFPTFQMGQLGIQQDSQITESILASVPENSRLRIATGYFNLTSNYMKTLIQDSRADCEILMAHPKANGFLGAHGIAGGIPFAYSLIAEKFRKQCEQYGQLQRITLLEYLKDGWTYHGKGLWYYSAGNNYPCMTMIGSPNFGDRSVSKDLESQLVIMTESEQLRKELHNECERLYSLGLPADTGREVPIWVNLFVSVFRSYF